MSHSIATDQREHRRLQLAPTIIRADIEQDGKRREGYLINVSLGGTFLSIADPPAKDTTTDLHMVLPWGIGECHVQACAVWEQTDHQERAIGAGLSFIDLSEDTSNQLQSYLDRFRERSPPRSRADKALETQKQTVDAELFQEARLRTFLIPFARPRCSSN